MRSQESLNSKLDQRRLSDFISQALEYVVDTAGSGKREIIPSLAAEKLKLSYVETLGVLMVLEDRGLLHHFYRVYCPASDGSVCDVSDKKDIPALIYCKFCGKEHGEADVDVEVVFRIDDEKLNHFLRNRAVA
jgi:hypothetical protein